MPAVGQTGGRGLGPSQAKDPPSPAVRPTGDRSWNRGRWASPGGMLRPVRRQLQAGRFGRGGLVAAVFQDVEPVDRRWVCRWRGVVGLVGFGGFLDESVEDRLVAGAELGEAVAVWEGLADAFFEVGELGLVTGDRSFGAKN